LWRLRHHIRARSVAVTPAAPYVIGQITPSGDHVQTSALQNLGSFPIALILFGAIAVFLILRLRSVLGKRVGFEKPPIPTGQMPRFSGGPIIDGQSVPVPPGRPVPDPRSALGERLMAIVNADSQFDPPKFLVEAETNFRVIVTAFAAGDRATLKSHLSLPVYQTFESVIAAREDAGQRHRTEIKRIISSTIEDAQMIADQAAIIVRFVSDQINLTVEKNGAPVIGTESVAEIVDLWTFERDLKSKDPTWRLAAARSG
jgi:predicted lipid-binding transport protein (Tim44 family)